MSKIAAIAASDLLLSPAAALFSALLLALRPLLFQKKAVPASGEPAVERRASRAKLSGALALLLLVSWSAETRHSHGPIQERNGSAAPVALQLSSGERPADAAELEHFLDTFFEEQMVAHHIPGAAFVLVKDGSLYLSKGYGYADLHTGQAVDPTRTLFNLGSVGKLFTATAIMQLVEQGRLNLADPVASYLGEFSITSDFAQPVTVAHLLTHTAGFEERVSGAWTADSDALVPLGAYLASSLPKVVLPPGEQISYSNHGYGLAGYLVEKVSGMTFAQYVEKNILAPIGMAHTSLAQPLPADLAQDLATGYAHDGDYVPLPPVYGNLPPAGGQHATATDMARFMLALLGDVRTEQAQLLQQDSARIMQSRQTGGDPRLEGYALGFAESFHGDLRALLKGGDCPGFASQLVIVPEHNLGYFVAFNASLGLVPVREELNRAFFERYYPLPEEVASGALAESDLRRFSGRYRLTRYARTTIDKAVAPLQMIQLRVLADEGTIDLTFPSLMGMESSAWKPVTPLLFREVGGVRYLGFQEDEEGRITHMSLNLAEPALLERVPWFETVGFQLALVTLFLLLFLSTLLWPLAAVKRWLSGRRSVADSGRTRARILAGMLAGLNLLFLTGIGVTIARAQLTGVTLLPDYLPLLLALPLLTSLLTAGTLVSAIDAWRNRRWSTLARLHYSLVASAGVLFIWFANYWNLLGYRL